jgi:hypothetical protein
MPTKEIDCNVHEGVDVAVSGDSRYLLVTVHDKPNKTVTHYSFSHRFGLEVETYHV